MPFFIRKSGNKKSSVKRKKEDAKPDKKNKKSKKEEVISSDEESGQEDKAYPDSHSSEDETEQEKKLRLTKQYLQKIEKEEQEKNLLDDTRDAVSQRLRDEALEEAGRLEKKKAHEYENTTPEVFCTFRGHKLSITCLVISNCEKFLFTASKDCSIIKWSLEDKKKLKMIPRGKKAEEPQNGHTDQVLALALSSDGKYLASGCKNKILNIWNADSLEHLKTFRGHKNAITGLAFQRGSHQLISASEDRSLKLWNLDEMGYVETLFGHQDAVTGLDCFHGETALTSGGRDSTIRIWKIVEESQLVFQGSGASIDCVCVSSHQCFISGSDDGSLHLWGTNKKKPLSKVIQAHGCDADTEEPNWILSVCSLPNTDLIASGSKDGFLRLWKRDDDSRSLTAVSRIPLTGFVNCMQFSQSGKLLAVGVGQEHRLGRWWRVKDAKNSVVIYTWKNK